MSPPKNAPPPPTIVLHPAQHAIAVDNHRFRVVCAGRRLGKTKLSVWEMTACAGIRPNARVAYIASTFQQARDIAWRELKDLVRPIASDINESRLEITLKNGSLMILRGWEAIETLRGQAFDLIVMDEVAIMRNFTESWQQVVYPTLTDKKGMALFISTPLGYNHFYELYNLEKKYPTEYKSFHYTSYDNPHLPKEVIDRAKEEMPEDAFVQEYLADFRVATGLAHKPWDRRVHLIPLSTLPAGVDYRGFDFGSAHPTASVKVRVDEDGNWFIHRCYKQNKRSIAEHAQAITEQDKEEPVSAIFGDPSGAQWMTEFDNYDLPIEPAIKETKQEKKGWVEHGVEVINQKLTRVPQHYLQLGNELLTNMPSLFVIDTPENLQIVKEFELLKWRETSRGGTTNTLDEDIDPDGHCDLLASLRYFAVSYYAGATGVQQINLPQGTKNIDPLRYEYNARQPRNSVFRG